MFGRRSARPEVASALEGPKRQLRAKYAHTFSNYEGCPSIAAASEEMSPPRRARPSNEPGFLIVALPWDHASTRFACSFSALMASM
jgi:hypothetical protein